jgi:signal peptidase I
MSEHDETPTTKPRNSLARLGVAALNLIAPGLGLFRISRGKLGTAFFSILFVLVTSLFLIYSTLNEMTFEIYVTILIILISGMVVAFLGSIVMTWRLSAHICEAPQWWSRWYGLIGIFGVAYAFTLIVPMLHSYYKPYFIPSKSMSPIIEVSDNIVVKHFDLGEIRRGDVLIIDNQGNPHLKRAVAIPNDRISMTNGLIFINGRKVAQELIETKTDPDSVSDSGKASILLEQLPGEFRPHRIIDLGVTQGDEWPETKLGPDEYFFLGDNRDMSADSRFTSDQRGLGIVQRERITGRALFRYWRQGVGLQGSKL